MKKLLIIIPLFFCFITTVYGWAYLPCHTDRNSDECRIQQLEEAQKQLELENQELQERYIKIQNNGIILNSLDEQITLLEDEKSITNYEEIIKILTKKQNIINENIILLASNNCLNPENCSVDEDNVELVELYRTKVNTLNNEIEIIQKELDSLYILEKDKLEEEKQAKLLEERMKKWEEYLEKANADFNKEDYKDAIKSYERACWIAESFECHYKLWVSQFELAKQYYEKRESYGYERLFNATIKESIENFEQAINLTQDEIKTEQATTLLEEASSYSNKEEWIIENNVVENKVDVVTKKVDIVWSRLETITSDYSEEEKQEVYTTLLSQLEAYKIKNTNENLSLIINALIEKLLEAIQDIEEQIFIYDRTEEFFKTTLQEKTYSCEISATSDILSTLKNKNFTEDELIQQIDKSKFDETAQYSNGIYIWWNPNAWYVWYIDTDAKGNVASQRNLTGYGVYEQPIAELYHSEWFKTKIINNSHYTQDFWVEQHLQKLLKEFTEGNYVQLWWDICTTSEYDDWELALADITQEDVDNGKNAKNECWSYGQDRKRVWYYEDGESLVKHQGLIWEHNFYLLGYEWDIDNPINIIVWDTSTGKHTYPVKEWMRKWEEMDFRSIIVYSK